MGLHVHVTAASTRGDAGGNSSPPRRAGRTRRLLTGGPRAALAGTGAQRGRVRARARTLSPTIPTLRTDLLVQCRRCRRVTKEVSQPEPPPPTPRTTSTGWKTPSQAAAPSRRQSADRTEKQSQTTRNKPKRDETEFSLVPAGAQAAKEEEGEVWNESRHRAADAAPNCQFTRSGSRRQSYCDKLVVTPTRRPPLR